MKNEEITTVEPVLSFEETAERMRVSHLLFMELLRTSEDTPRGNRKRKAILDAIERIGTL